MAGVTSSAADLAPLQQAVEQAEQLYEAGQFTRALALYRNLVVQRLAQVISSNGEWRAKDTAVIERLADLAMLEGSFVAAEDLLKGLRDLYRRANNDFAAHYITTKLCHLALENDDVRGAHQYLRLMSDVIGDLESIDLSAPGLRKWEAAIHWPAQDNDSRQALLVRLYFIMGGLLASYGQCNDALSCLERGESLACGSLVPSVLQVCVPIRMSLASVCLLAGRFADSREWLAQIDATVSPGPAFEIRALELHGKLAMLQGRYGEALNTFEQVVTQSSQLGFTRPIAMSSLNLAHLLILLNQTQEALTYIERAKTVAEHNPSVRLRAANLRALAFARRESLAEQVAIAPTVTEMWANIPAPEVSPETQNPVSPVDPLDLPSSADFLSFFEDRALAVQWRLSQHRFTEAAELVDTLSRTFLASDSPLIHARIKALKGMVVFYREAYPEAIALLTDAIEGLQALGAVAEIWQSKRIISWCYSRVGRSSQEIAELDAEIQEELDQLASSLNQVDRSTFLINKWTAAEEYFLGEINQLVATVHRGQTRWWRRLSASIATMNKLNTLLLQIDRYKLNNGSRFLSVGHQAPVANEVPSLWRRLLFHPWRAATIHFLVLPDRVLLIQQSWLRLGFGVSAITRGDLRDLVSTWYRQVDKVSDSRDLGERKRIEKKRTLEQTQRQTLDRLADSLQLRSLLDALPRRVKTLCIAADDSLLGFPFAVLQYRNVPLPEKFAINMVFPRSTDKVMPRQSNQALLVGVSRGNSMVAPLPQVDPELDAVQAWSQQQGYSIDRRVNELADKNNILEALQHARLFHIACHGVFRPDQPGDTGFVLIPNAQQTQVLSLIDLARLDLGALEHATLSSCWAADRFILPGRQTIGLPETFLYRGAGSVLACLWPVDDLVASLFTARFYHYLTSSPPDEALRRTQRDCLQNQLISDAKRGGDTRSPIYWAGFNLYRCIAI